jgi:ribonuclease BN (tRNA processing enzyme)
MSVEKPDMIVTILGSGTCVPSLERSSCSVMVEVGGARLLFDSGPGTMRRLLRTNTTIFDVDYICYSHFHPDHTAELVPFLFATKYPDMSQRQTVLTIVAGMGFKDFYTGLKTVYGKWIELDPGLVEIIQMDNQSADLRRLKDFTLSPHLSNTTRRALPIGLQVPADVRLFTAAIRTIVRILSRFQKTPIF